MISFIPIFFRRNHFFSRIYRLFFAVAWVSCVVCPLYSQEINSFRTATSGLFNNIGTWEVFDGVFWIPATSVPSSGNDIYIDQTHTLSLTSNQSVKSVFINAETGAGQKLILNGNALEIFGTLQAFSGAAPGTPSGTWNSQNWIGNSIDSRLVFRGPSRTIIPQNSWSGFSTQSRYSVIFDPGDGIELTIEEPFKSMRFIIRSGTVIQEVDNQVTPATCASLSFNTEDFFGLNEYGELIIENGATFLSKCNSDILFRSSTRSAALLEIEDGGELILEGSNPEMEVFQYQIDGKVIFSSGSSTKAFITKSFGSSGLPFELHDLELRSNQNLTLPASLSISGDLIQSGSGQFDFTSTSLKLEGSETQNILNFPLVVLSLILDKPSGEAFFNTELTVLSELELINGGLNLQQNELNINLLGSGGLNYQGGYWRDLSNFIYFNIPSLMDESNFTLPFLDQFQGGIRKIQLLGNSPGGTLNLNFQEYSGADFDPQFNDSDGTPILYRLFSYFDFSGIGPFPLPIEMRISADQLIVDNVDDIRVVGTGYAAPGTNLTGLDLAEPWARRALNFGELEATNFTVGSFRTLSVLPVVWLDIEAKNLKNHTSVSWTVARELNNEKFEVYRSKSGISEWMKIGEIASLGDTDLIRNYYFDDLNRNKFERAFYRIKQIDNSGLFTYSDVASIEGVESETLKIFPNPHAEGPIEIVFPNGFDLEKANIKIIGLSSNTVFESQLNIQGLKSILDSLPPGVYGIYVSSKDQTHFTRLLKK